MPGARELARRPDRRRGIAAGSSLKQEVAAFTWTPLVNNRHHRLVRGRRPDQVARI
jgi:hypothetical protein